MTDENFSMKRSRSQLATIYAPGAFFTFEGGMGACIAHPAARIRADLTDMLKNQIVDSINERVRNWEAQGMNCRREGGQPPVDPELVLDAQLRNDGAVPRLQGDRLAFLVPDVMNYVPEPLTFVCRRCGLMKDFRNAEGSRRETALSKRDARSASETNRARRTGSSLTSSRFTGRAAISVSPRSTIVGTATGRTSCGTGSSAIAATRTFCSTARHRRSASGELQLH